MALLSFADTPLLLPLILASVSACGGVGADTSGGGGTMTHGDASSATSATGTGGASASASASSTDSSSASTSGAGGAGLCSGRVKGPGDSDEMVASGSDMRGYHVHVPKGYVPTAPSMLVLVFHGIFEQGKDVENVSQMDGASDAHKFIAVYPDGLGTSWNAGKCCLTAQSQNVDDVKFVRDLLDRLEADYCVDPKRVYAAGYSNGGMLSQRLACELSDRIAAIGPVSGPMAASTCTPPRPVPVIEFHGTGDFVVPYNGGGLGGADSVKDTIAAWVTRDACTDAMPASVYQQGDASCVEYAKCMAGAAVRLCTIDQGGHQWPGGQSSGAINGKVSTDIKASEEMFKFFAAHPMP